MRLVLKIVILSGIIAGSVFGFSYHKEYLYLQELRQEAVQSGSSYLYCGPPPALIATATALIAMLVSPVLILAVRRCRSLFGGKRES
jgi:hypothetical protein